MNILINMATLKIGGGQNVAFNFLLGLERLQLDGVKLHFLVARNSALHHFMVNHGNLKFSLAPKNPVLRIIYEILVGPFLLMRYKIDLVYSYFGYAVFPTRVPQVAGSADSNIYFPEIDFWREYGGFQKAKRWLVDQYRIWCVRRASAVVFENPAMEERGRRLHSLNKTRYIRPSLTFSNITDECALPDAGRNRFQCLFLCGWHLNKNVMMIPLLAKAAKERGLEISFILTAPVDNNPIHKKFMALVREVGVEDCINVIGQIKKNQLASLYEQVGCVLLLSKLESFSNNIIEAWHFKRPLIVSSEEWAKSICADAALFVDRESVSSVLHAIEAVIPDGPTKTDIVKNGVIQLSKYPSIEERVRLEFEYLLEIYESH